MARESGKGEECRCGGNSPGALRWCEHEKSKEDCESQSETADPSEARVCQHRPCSSVEAHVGERLAENIRGEPDEPHRTGQDRQREPGPDQNVHVFAQLWKIPRRTNWPDNKRREENRPRREQSRCKMRSTNKRERIG